MLKIEEEQLKLLLEKRKNLLGTPKYNGMGDIISSVSLMVTLLLSDFNNLTVLKPLYFKIGAWIVTLAIFFVGLFKLIRSMRNSYRVEQLYSEIADIDPDTEHPFDIIVIKSPLEGGKYLVFKSVRWGCWLFPNYHCLPGTFQPEKERGHIRDAIKRDLIPSGKFQIKYLGNRISKKYSVGDKVNKKYNFHYFQVETKTVILHSKRKRRFNGKTYSWKTLDEMYRNKNIRKKNEDVLDYVRQTCDIS